jgi:glycosyltransferase involved in cell wall biosynthesis
MVHYSREIQRQGCAGINSCWANFPTLMATVADRFFGVPFCMTCRAWDIFVPMNQTDLPEKIAAARVVRTNNDAGSKFVRRFCRSETDEEKIQRIYNPIDVRGIACRDEVPEGPPTLVAGGSLVEQKVLGYLLDALSLLLTRGLDCHLRIVGEGPLREELETRSRHHGLSDAVEFCGTVPNHELMAMMTGSTAFVLPSVPARSGQMDGIPNVLIESMALGVPVVSTSISGIPELVQDGESGFLVPPRDAERLADAIERLVGDPELQREFSRRGRRRVESMFEMSANARALIEVYESAGLLSQP